MKSGTSEISNQLIQQAQNGDLKAFQEIYILSSRVMLNVALKMVRGDLVQAEDIVQDAWIDIKRNLHQFQFEGSFEGWLKTIVRNRCFRHFSKQKRQKEVLEYVKGEQSTLEIVDSTDLEIHHVIRLVDRLPQTHKEAIQASLHGEGLSQKDIAKKLGISKSAFMVRLHRARAALKSELETAQISLAA